MIEHAGGTVAVVSDAEALRPDGVGWEGCGGAIALPSRAEVQAPYPGALGPGQSQCPQASLLTRESGAFSTSESALRGPQRTSHERVSQKLQNSAISSFRSER